MPKLLAGLQDETAMMKAGKPKKGKKGAAAAAEPGAPAEDTEADETVQQDGSTKLEVAGLSRSGRAVKPSLRQGTPASVFMQFAAREQVQQYQAATAAAAAGGCADATADVDATAAAFDDAEAARLEALADSDAEAQVFKRRVRRQCTSDVVRQLIGYQSDEEDDSGHDSDYLLGPTQGVQDDEGMLGDL
jgi:hypothetical protein